jgi:hypothetical protein
MLSWGSAAVLCSFKETRTRQSAYSRSAHSVMGSASNLLNDLFGVPVDFLCDPLSTSSLEVWVAVLLDVS